MRTLIASAALATALFAAPQLALAQAGDPAKSGAVLYARPRQSPELLLSDCQINCEQNTARFSPEYRCLENPHAAANRVYEQVEPGVTTGAGQPRPVPPR